MNLSAPGAWHPALAVNQLTPGAMSVWKHDGQQILLCQSQDGEHFAVDNRCPHEGYPLISGDLKDCALTCSWHNWKFDVRDGSCTLGEEGVRAYPVRVRAGVIEVDLSEPEPSAAWPALLESFDEGLQKHQVARCARDGVRLLKADYNPHQLLARVALYDARHGEYGTTHATPVAADCGRLLERYNGLDAMFAIAPAVDMCGEACLRLPARSRPSAIAGGTLEDLLDAVETEQTERALGLLRGAFEDGRERSEIEDWMYAVLAQHFLNFGHPLIYMVKLGELFERAGEEYAEEIYEGLLYSICLGTREDTLPYMSGYFRRFDEFMRAQPAGWRAVQRGIAGEHRAACEALRDAALDGSLNDAMQCLSAALSVGASLEQLAGALVAAAAERLLRFDLALDTDTSVAEGWLWATHRLTAASAARNAVLRHNGPTAVRFLVHTLAFTHSGRGMDMQPAQRFGLEAREASVEEVLAAIGERRAGDALAGALHLAAEPESRRALQIALEELCLSDTLVRPIVVAHAIKTLAVGFEEFDAQAGTPHQSLALAASVRFLASPLQERRVREAVQRSIQWVGEGVMPRKLTQ